jgi:two-component SAPR family response regulator
MAQAAWADKATTWATDTNVWANTTYQDTITLNSNGSFLLGYNTKYAVDAILTQLNLSELNEEDAIKLATALLGTVVGTTAAANIIAPVSGILSNTNTIKNNVNFEESGVIGMSGSASSNNNFLWNDEVEDTSAIWTKISDPDE